MDEHDMHGKPAVEAGVAGTMPRLSYLSKSGARLHTEEEAKVAEATDDGSPVPPNGGNDDKERIPLRYRLLAFSMILFFATSSSFCEATLGPLKGTLIKQLGINSGSLSGERSVQC